MQYAIWTANLLTPQHKIILITEPGKEKESIVRLARVGFENVVGFIEGGFEALLNYAIKNEENLKYLTKLDIPDLSKVKEHLEEILAKKENYQVLDVREKGEIETSGVIDPDAITIPLAKLEIDENIQRVIKAGENKTIAVHCKTGGRAAVAAAILKRHGVDRVSFLGGILNMQEKNVPFYKK
jgi:hydroxyacylglutathione hydrolase